jgi:peptidoglycan/LPS O-acetylase OafA/YrhL
MNRKLLILNGLAILGVTVQHANAYGMQAMFFWTDRYLPVTVPNFDQLDSLAYYLTLTIRQLATFAVPGFLFISGFFIAFIAKGEESRVTWRVIASRLKFLVIPFVLWTGVRFLMLGRIPSSVDDVLGPYHFIPMLIQFYLISPILVPVAKRWGKELLIGAAVLHLGLQTVNYINGLGLQFVGQELINSLTPRWFILGQQPFWFPFGLVAGLHIQQFQTWLARTRRTLLTGAVAFAPVAVLEYQFVDQLNGEPWLAPSFGGFARTFYILAFLLWFLALEREALPFPESLSNLGARSLGIYLGNIPFIYVVAVFMYHVTPWMLGRQFFYQAILFSVGLFGPLLLMFAVRKSPVRGLYRYIFG